ncbi:hypothetical protein SEA_COLUCCI_88 [Arthrobacter phage Colucci]|uniref:Uncharacterized protein n=1 Tax=Arthrobacter phage Colucci TaxID=2015834 RepID=A0A286N300_9CAUD|nr:hypothetical protein FDI27_gp088 [Arthrobacter phage Colucci]ASX98757.1 hypothetical protein SEA_COLUCCI_88 [Arthrobacter phage Colucci]
MEDSRECLHCGQTRGQVRAERTYCATVSVGETVEALDEWDTHRWADWKDAEIPNFIKPEAKKNYRRTRVDDFQWAACDDTTTGHKYPVTDEDKSFFQAGQCIFCGIEEPTNA